MKLIAYELDSPLQPTWTITPASSRRTWMDRIPHAFAYRCLPLTMANQMGWVIGCPCTFTVEWNGSPLHGQLRFVFHEDTAPAASCVSNHFGNGILTFKMPWLFQTVRNDISKATAGWGPKDHFMKQAKDDPEALWQELSNHQLGDPFETGLLVRGMPNRWMMNCHPLEGFVETWWLPFTFTMNWKIIEPNYPVLFQQGDPICFIQPYGLDTLEVVGTELKHISEEPELLKQYQTWARSRDKFNYDPNRLPKEWQRCYHQGVTPDGVEGDNHRTGVTLPTFERRQPDAEDQEGESKGSASGDEAPAQP